MKYHLKRLMALCLCFAIILAFFPAIAPVTVADAAMYTQYTTIAKISTQGGCNAMQGMDVDGSYIYCAKINSETETTCSIARVDKNSGDIVYLKNSATGTNYFSQLAHANDLAVCTINGVKTLFVGTGGKGKGDYSLVRFSFSNGTTLKEVAHYNMKHNGSEKYIAGVKVVATSSTDISLVLKQGNYVYTATIPYSAASGDIAMEYVGKLDFSAVNFGGTIKDLSNYVQQGFGYKDNKLFVPMTANYQTSTSHISSIVCFDFDGIKNGTLKPNPNMSVWIEDTTYPDLFEIESCGICPTDGKLYFATNCRKTSTDGNHDSVHVLNGFVYNPAMGDPTTGQNYHFRPSAGKMKSVTTGASVYNSVLQHMGTVTNGNKITSGRWSLDMPILLKHNDPWILTWESSNWTGNSLLLSTYDTSSYPNNYYLYRRSSGLVALGYHSNGQYNNYGVDLSKHGIDDTVTHKYQLKNQVNADGTNMVYLWVDGTKLGAMNNHYIDTTAQNKTNDWVSGKDFSFSYIGTAQHPVACTLQSLQVWTKGNINAFDEPNVFRWETQSNKMTPISQFGYTTNAVTVLGGSCSNGTYSNYYNRLAQPLVLMHNKPWVVEWKTPSWSGNTMLFSSADRVLKVNASYLYRSKDIVAFGYSDGSMCHSYGIMLADHEVSATAGHTYRLTNKINSDGSNMVYLTVDGQELGPMNRYYLGSEYQGATSDFVNGKDFTFPYMGNYQYGLNQAYDYIQVWENGIPASDAPEQFRWETSGSSFKNVTSGNYTANTANRVMGEISNGVFDNTTYRLDTPIVLQHNQAWCVSWESAGVWTDGNGGAFLLSASQNNSETNAPYIYCRKGSAMIGFGYYDGSKNVQYGVNLADFGIDATVNHTYTLTNKVAPDGSNMVYLSLDGQELGAMDQYFVGGHAEGTTSNWVSGKDFTFPYIGTPKYPLSQVTVNYLEVSEGTTHTHSYSAWTVTEPATCTTGGTRTRTCSGCGEIETQSIDATGHSYMSTVVGPSCTAPGYTGYTCTVCGDTYQDHSTPATGHSYHATVVEPTCTTGGYTTYRCTICGGTYQSDNTPATGHNYKTIVIDPTCTTGGYTTYRCTICGGTYQSDNTPATGHDYSTVVIAPSCIDQGYTIYTCKDCGSSYTGSYTPATGHRYSAKVTAPTCSAGGYTTYTCGSCGHSYKDQITNPAGHNYVDGICGSCGAADPNYETPVVQPTLTLKSPTLEFKDMICIVAFYTAENIEDVVEMGMITYSSNVTSWSVDTAENVIPGASYAEDSGRYYSSSQGIHAKYLGDTVYLAIYAKLSDGTYAYSKLASYSALTYASSQLKNSTDASLKQLVVAMLNYGAEAQRYFGHNTSALANAGLSAEQLLLPEAYRADMVSSVPATSAAKQGMFANNSGFSSRKPAISFEGAFCINYFFTPNYVPENGITLYYWNAADYNAAGVLTTDNASGWLKLEGTAASEYRGDITGISAKALSEAVYVAAIYTNGGTTWTSGVLGYSIGTYCSSQASKGGTIADLAMATAVYGYHAKQYFG